MTNLRFAAAFVLVGASASLAALEELVRHARAHRLRPNRVVSTAQTLEASRGWTRDRP